ncbi:MAG TPA: hypothetical protein VIJ17_00105, partial [Pseudolabrys sp.]
MRGAPLSVRTAHCHIHETASDNCATAIEFDLDQNKWRNPRSRLDRAATGMRSMPQFWWRKFMKAILLM